MYFDNYCTSKYFMCGVCLCLVVFVCVLNYMCWIELPRLLAPPGVVHGSITANNATIEWRKWNPERGDPGHPEILWYNVYVRSATENVRMAGIVYHAFCQEKCRYTLTGLQPNTRYFVYLTVRREGNGGDGPEGPTIHLTTKCAGQ